MFDHAICYLMATSEGLTAPGDWSPKYCQEDTLLVPGAPDGLCYVSDGATYLAQQFLVSRVKATLAQVCVLKKKS